MKWSPRIFGSLFAALLLVQGLVGCGYHLRGYEDGGVSVPVRVFISGNGGDSAFRQALERTIKLEGGSVEKTRTDGIAAVTLQQATLTREVLSIADSGKVSAYRLTFKLQYRLLGDTKSEASTEKASAASESQSVATTRVRSLRVVRDFQFSTAQALSAADEERRLRDELRQDAVDRLLRVLAR